MGKLDKVEKYVQKGKEPELIKLAHDHDKTVRLAAIAGLGKVGRDDACNILITMLLEADADIRIASANALGELGDPRARTLLTHHLTVEKDEAVIAAVKAALPKLRHS